MELAERLRELEEELLRVEVRKDASRVAALLADDFREFGSSGRIYSKAEIIAHLQDEVFCPVTLRDFELTSLSPSLAMVTYRVLCGEPNEKPAQSLRNSLWELRDGRWQIRFHQGTKIPAV